MKFRRRSTVPAVEERPTRLWSPAWLVAFGLGGAAIAFGVIALTRTGLDLSHVTRDHDSLLGFGHTPLLGLAEVGFGVLLVLAALGPIAGRNIMTLVGAAAAGLGLVVAAGWWSVKMSSWLGVTDRSGWLVVAAGGLALFAAFFLPVLTTGGPRIVREPVITEAPASTVAVPPGTRPHRPRPRLPPNANRGSAGPTATTTTSSASPNRPASSSGASGERVRARPPDGSTREVPVDHLVHVHEVRFLARIEPQPREAA